MTISRSLPLLLGLPMLVALVTSGCATKKYVAETVAPIEKRIGEVDKKSSEAVANLGEKLQKDISRVEERAMTADSKAVDAGRSAQQADAKAVQATQLAQNSQRLGEQNRSKIGDVERVVEAIEKYKLVATDEVLFDFNKAVLTPEAASKLDQIVQNAGKVERPILEVEGFTDPIGSKDYNLSLSRRRADAVVRYLVGKGVPLRRVHVLGLGSEQQPGAEAMPKTAKERAEVRKQMRRVVLRTYGLEGPTKTGG